MRIEEHQRLIAEERAAKDQAYLERNRILQLLTKVMPAHLRRHEPPNDPNWDEAWRWVVCVHPSQSVQLTWHIHDSQLQWFDHLTRHPLPGHVLVFGSTRAERFDIECRGWDGHTTDEKHRRIQDFPLRFAILR